jgi:hypothetical protein
LVGWATQGTLSEIFECIVLLQAETADRSERAFEGISRNDACTLVASRVGQIEHEPISTGQTMLYPQNSKRAKVTTLRRCSFEIEEPNDYQ